MFDPQHLTPPTATTAHVWSDPVAMAMADTSERRKGVGAWDMLIRKGDCVAGSASTAENIPLQDLAPHQLCFLPSIPARTERGGRGGGGGRKGGRERDFPPKAPRRLNSEREEK